MAKQKAANTENKSIKTEALEEILKRKELQNKMFEKMICEIKSPIKKQNK